MKQDNQTPTEMRVLHHIAVEAWYYLQGSDPRGNPLDRGYYSQAGPLWDALKAAGYGPDWEPAVDAADDA